ncbi:DNA topoisomerase [Alkalihalobacillus oceani]|uniref:DNA topoisomerase n=1 Tax=Halalkalibacter oceani TaxID=1653776 RepID=A0A9X2DUE2_9BACI|nr:DNA topoisomerase [Halalkalibacter oceani]MCM3716265.1 DNA topoisomerase [Halalkalibacter oceani]
MSILIITDNLSKGEKIAASLLKNFQSEKGYLNGNGYYITWTSGHLIGLAPTGFYDIKYETWDIAHLPILPKPFQWIIDPKMMDQVKVIRELSDRSNMIINALEPGPEGQYIFDSFYRHLKLTHPVKRLWLSDMTQEGIVHAYQNMKANDYYRSLGEAERARVQADWLIGINATRAISTKHQAMLSVGRVQTPVLAMVYDRNKEIENYVSDALYDVVATFTQGETTFEGSLINEEIKSDELKALECVKVNQNVDVSLKLYIRKREKMAAPRLFNLSSLQSEANELYGFSLKETLDIATVLYEKHELITYPATDSQYVSPEDITTMHKVFDKLNGLVKIKGIEWARKEIVTSGCQRICQRSDYQHAILPTEKLPTNQLSENEKKIYILIVQRFFSQFFPPARYEKHEMIYQLKHEFKSVVSVLIDPGWKVIENPKLKLSTFNVDETKPISLVKCELKKTNQKPPLQYTEGNLVQRMLVGGKEIGGKELNDWDMEASIGTAKSRAEILTVLKSPQIGYLVVDDNKLSITKKGKALIELLRQTDVKTITDPQMTGEWEKKLYAIERGTGRADPLLSSLEAFISLFINEINQMEPQRLFLKDSLGKCPACSEGEIVEGKKAYGCNRFKEGCEFKLWKTINRKQLSEAQIKQLLTQGSTSFLTFKSAAGKSYVAKLVVKDWKQGTVTLDDKLSECPKCNTGMIKDKGPLYGCTHYPSCDFKIFKSISSRIISPNEVIDLITQTKTSNLTGFRTKNGDLYDAFLYLDENLTVKERRV